MPVEGQTVTCDFGDLPVGDNAQIDIFVTAREPGTYTNTARVSSAEDDPDTGNNEDSATNTVVAPPSGPPSEPPPEPPAEADLSVQKTASDNPATVGEPLIYTLTVTNDGPSPAENVTLVDSLPDEVDVDSADPQVCDAEGDGVVCSLGDLGAGESTTLELTVTPTEAATITNTASVGSDTDDPDEDDNTDSVTTEVGPDELTARTSGAGRVETAIEISQSAFDEGEAGAVVLSRSNLYPDALAGTPLAIARNAPLLLSATEALNPLTEAEIQRVLPAGGTVFVLGGVEALSDAVASRLTELGFQVTRYGGANRFATAVVIADQGLGNPATLLAATGNDFADALAAGAVGGVEDVAIVLTAAATLPPETGAYLDARPQTTRYGVGGPASAAVPGSIPLAGPTRFETAVLVAEEFFDTPELVGVARAREFADALAGGADVGRDGGPILLSETEVLADTVRDYLEDNADSIDEARIYGGVQAISEQVAADVGSAIED